MGHQRVLPGSPPPPECLGVYLDLEREAGGIPLPKTEDLGIFVDLEKRQRFLLWHHVEVMDDPANPDTP